MLHLDVKKLGKIDGVGYYITVHRQHHARGIGREYAHVAIDDCSRLAYYNHPRPTSPPADYHPPRE